MCTNSIYTLATHTHTGPEGNKGSLVPDRKTGCRHGVLMHFGWAHELGGKYSPLRNSAGKGRTMWKKNVGRQKWNWTNWKFWRIRSAENSLVGFDWFFEKWSVNGCVIYLHNLPKLRDSRFFNFCILLIAPPFFSLIVTPEINKMGHVNLKKKLHNTNVWYS